MNNTFTFKLIGFIVIVLTVFIGCNSSSDISSSSINSTSSSENSISSSSSSNSSTSSSLGEITLGTTQGILLNEFIDTPIQIIDNEEDLNQLYSDLNVTRDEDINPDFTTDSVVYLQRDGVIGANDGVAYIQTAALISMSLEGDGIRLASTINNTANKSARIVILKNAINTSIFFTQVYKYQIDDSSCFSDQSKLYVRDLNITNILGNYPIIEESFFGSDMRTFIDKSFFEDYLNQNKIEIPLLDINYSSEVIFTAGSLNDNSQIHYSNAVLKEIYVKNAQMCQVTPGKEIVITQKDLLVFEINGIRSDCTEFNTIIDKNITMYSISKNLTTDEFGNLYMHRIESIKSCTGYVTTPEIEDVKWYEEFYYEK